MGLDVGALIGGLGGGGATSGTTATAKQPSVTVGADPVSAIAGAVGSIFSFGASMADKKNIAAQGANDLTNALIAKKAAEDKQKRMLVFGILGVMAIIIIVVLVFTLRKK